MKIRLFTILILSAAVLFISCREPEKADLKTYLPAGTLVYMETGDLEGITRVFTQNSDWKAVAKGPEQDMSFLRGKQAALAVTGFHGNGEGEVLQVKPKIVLAIDTRSSGTGAAMIAEPLLKKLSERFFGRPGEIEKIDSEGVQWINAVGDGDKRIFSVISGGVLVVSNDRDAAKDSLNVHEGKAGSLAKNETIASEREQRGPAAAAFGYVSPHGVKELSDYLGISYALKSSENTTVRGLVSEMMPRIAQQTVTSVTWWARPVEGGVEDTFFFKTDKEFAGTFAQTVKAGPGKELDTAFIPADAYSISHYSLEQPQIAWRGAVLSLAKQLEGKDLILFEQFSRSLLQPYGINDPEMFLSAVDPEIATIRFDADGDLSAARVKVKDRGKIEKSIAEFIDIRGVPQVFGDRGTGARLWESKDGEFAAALTEDDYFIIGVNEAVRRCLEAGKAAGYGAPEMPASFQITGAILESRQQDDSAQKIFSGISQDGQRLEKKLYSFTETRVEPQGIKRRTVSAFGLFGEMFKQAFEN
jgi:hypothetical protein